MNLIYRKSKPLDILGIEYLVSHCFGVRDQYGVYDDLFNRYWLCIDEDKQLVVGMSGLKESFSYKKYGDADTPEFNGPEIAYSCTLPEYRKQGIMSHLISLVIKEAKEHGHERLYCSAWRICGRNNANLHSILVNYDFEQILHPEIAYMVGHNCWWGSDQCQEYFSKNCYCYEDLYVKYLKEDY